MMALDAGAEDFSEEEDSFEIITDPDDFSKVREALEAEQIPMASAEVTMIPQTYVQLTDEQDLYNINKTLDLLDEDEDVQEVCIITGMNNHKHPGSACRGVCYRRNCSWMGD